MGYNFLYLDKGLYDSALLKSDHSHPVKVGLLYNIPSGLPDHYPEYIGRGDIASAQYEVNKAISKGHPIPIYRFYVQKKGYRKYHINSTYKQFSRMPDWLYEK